MNEKTEDRSEEKYKNVYHLLPDAIVVFDMNGIIISYNESFKDLFGYSSQELRGKSIFVIVSDDGLDLAHNYLDKILKTGGLKNKENILKKKDGTIFPSLFSVNTMSYHNDSIIEYICIIKDISEIHNARKKLEETSNTIQEQLDNLRDIDKLKNEFFVMISHELKTPLVAIQGYSELFLDGAIGHMTQEQKDTMKIIYDNSIHLRQIIDDILDAQKIELGKINLDIYMVSAKELVNTCVQTFKLQAESKGVLLESKCDDIMISCDRRRIIQILNNLVSNALKLVPEKIGRIQITCQKQDETATFSVKDNGMGLSQEEQKNMFKKFYQVDTSLGRKTNGTGLGLAISKGILEAHKGNIWIESSMWNGTTFYFTLPLVRR